MPSHWLTTAEVASRAGVTPQYIRMLARRGRIPAEVTERDERRSYRFPAAEVAAWLAGDEGEAGSRRLPARVAGLQKQVTDLVVELERERAGRRMAELTIYQLRQELERARRAVAVFLEDVSDPSEALARRRAEE